MRKWIETTGRSEEDAIAAALFQLGLDRDDVSVEVLERAKSGFLGFGGNPAKVRVSYEVPDGDAPAAPEQPEPAPQTEPAGPKAQPEPQAEACSDNWSPVMSCSLAGTRSSPLPFRRRRLRTAWSPPGRMTPRRPVSGSSSPD